jgi:hypothetical protein
MKGPKTRGLEASKSFYGRQACARFAEGPGRKLDDTMMSSCWLEDALQTEGGFGFQLQGGVS